MRELYNRKTTIRRTITIRGIWTLVACQSQCGTDRGLNKWDTWKVLMEMRRLSYGKGDMIWGTPYLSAWGTESNLAVMPRLLQPVPQCRWDCFGGSPVPWRVPCPMGGPCPMQCCSSRLKLKQKVFVDYPFFTDEKYMKTKLWRLKLRLNILTFSSTNKN